MSNGLDMWAEERAEERSMTWKERHAKGVVVTMDAYQFYNRLRELPEGDATEYACLDKGYPTSGQSGDGAKITFCNFRYKPEWIAKQSRKNCHGFASEQPKAQCTGSL